MSLDQLTSILKILYLYYISKELQGDIKELVLTELPKQLGGHLETHTLTEQRLLSASQHHTRDDSNVKLGLKEPHKKKDQKEL